MEGIEGSEAQAPETPPRDVHGIREFRVMTKLLGVFQRSFVHFLVFLELF